MINEPELKNIEIEKIVLDEKNPNKMSEEKFKALKKVMETYGYLVPIIVDKNYKIADGEHRFLIYKELGKKTIPAYILDIKDPDRRIIRQVMNKLKGEHDPLLDLEEFQNLDGLGKLDELKEFLPDENFDFMINEKDKNIEEDNFDVSSAIKEPKFKINLGDIFFLGNHRVMCGDSSNDKDMSILMGGGQAVLTITDPPYNMDFTGSIHSNGKKSFNANHGRLNNDNNTKELELSFIRRFLDNVKQFSNGPFYIFYYRLGVHKLINLLEENYHGTLIWKKNNHTLSNSDYMSIYEPIVYGWFGKHNFYGNPSFDVIESDRTQKNDLHPTMKPLELLSILIKNSSKQKDICLDIFGGSGSTLIACEALQRNCYMMEIDPVYCSVILERYIEFVKSDKSCFKINQDGTETHVRELQIKNG